jgi:fatty acid desaturase
MTRIEKQTLRALHRPGWRGTWFVLGFGTLFYALVGLTVYCLAEALYWPAAALVLVNTYLSHSLVIAFHEAAHGSLCPWRPLNEYLGRVIGLQAFISLSLYRELHHWHHAHLGTPRDEEFWPFTDPANAKWKRRLAAIGELFFGVLYTPLLYFRAYIRTGSRIQIPVYRRVMIWAEVLAPFLVWGGVTAVTIYYEVFTYYLISYLAPAFLAGNVQSWRKYIEHVGLTGDSWATLTRAIRPPTTAGHVVSESLLHEPYHDLHHRYPKIPYENLPHAAAVDPPTDGVPLFPSYRAALWDLLKALPDPKFGPAWKLRIEPQMNTENTDKTEIMI